MGRGRQLCYALNAARRRREEELDGSVSGMERRPGINPLLGRGIRPKVPRFDHWERVLGDNNSRYVAQGRSRSFPAPPQPDTRRQPHSQPSCFTLGFGYVVPNAQFPPRLNSPFPCAPNPPCHLPPPPPPLQDQTDSEETESTSSGFDSEDGDSLEANCGSP